MLFSYCVETIRDGQRQQEGGRAVNCYFNKFKYFSPVFAELDCGIKT